MTQPPELKPQRMVDDLIALQALTGNEQGAQRLAWNYLSFGLKRA